MDGRNPPSFFSMKKKPATAGQVEGWMYPDAKASSMYVSMAKVSGLVSGYTLLLGGTVLGNSSIALFQG